MDFYLIKHLVSSPLIENEGKKKEVKLVIDETCEHVENALVVKTLTFAIWFKPSKKECAEILFISTGNISDVYYGDKVTSNVFTDIPSTLNFPVGQQNKDDDNVKT